jgi:hypothetical protein
MSKFIIVGAFLAAEAAIIHQKMSKINFGRT